MQYRQKYNSNYKKVFTGVTDKCIRYCPEHGEVYWNVSKTTKNPNRGFHTCITCEREKTKFFTWQWCSDECEKQRKKQPVEKENLLDLTSRENNLNTVASFSSSSSSPTSFSPGGSSSSFSSSSPAGFSIPPLSTQSLSVTETINPSWIKRIINRLGTEGAIKKKRKRQSTNTRTEEEIEKEFVDLTSSPCDSSIMNKDEEYKLKMNKKNEHDHFAAYYSSFDSPSSFFSPFSSLSSFPLQAKNESDGRRRAEEYEKERNKKNQQTSVLSSSSSSPSTLYPHTLSSDFTESFYSSGIDASRSSTTTVKISKNDGIGIGIGIETENNTNHLCIICMDETKCVVCVPCGHVSFCVKCSQKLKTHGNRCPVCRADIKSHVKIYV